MSSVIPFKQVETVEDRNAEHQALIARLEEMLADAKAHRLTQVVCLAVIDDSRFQITRHNASLIESIAYADMIGRHFMDEMRR